MIRKKSFINLIKSILNSYSQIFFSSNKYLSIIILITTFFDIYAGLCGFLAVLISNLMAFLLGFNKQNIKSGLYGFNSLLVGLGLGIHFEPSYQLFLILLFSAILTLFLSIFFENIIGKYKLPFLSIPFLISIWMITLAARSFKSLELSERGIFFFNEIYNIGGAFSVKSYEFFNNLNFHESIEIYFKSIGAIFFQYNILAGILIAIGILIYSRIAFLLSVIGFFCAYFYYFIIGGNISELSYSFIGFNFILTSIALGGFFIIPSKYSFLWILLIIPLNSIFLSSTTVIFGLFQLSVYSLPFNISVLLFLYILKFRERNFLTPELVFYQNNSPESNLYSQLNSKERFSKSFYYYISFPFWGEWKVSQGQNGEITHKGEWQHAWDFVVVDDNNNSFRIPGMNNEDFYCYNKPVLAPAEGWIEEISDGTDDNDIGDVNTVKNWGNTIIIKHANFLYTKLSHLKSGSIKFNKGDYVKKGEYIANCGSSGRSPEPHLHFQIQSTPYIGSKTIDYPITHYILRKKNKYELKSYDKPKKDELISNVVVNSLLKKAFHLIPGQNINFTAAQNGRITVEKWEVCTDVYNNSYIYCTKTKSAAYFVNDGTIFYFTGFYGSKKSLLFLFYLGAYKILLGFYKDLKINDSFPLHNLNNKFLLILQDFIAPFYIFMKSEFQLNYSFIDDYLSTGKIILESSTTVKIANKITNNYDFTIELNKHGFKTIKIVEKQKITELAFNNI